jgi:hypothetical protein|tara:strand:- start:547 stop:996 length:450 start_codon:yes stop_codon:yes gene_type:complete
MSWSYDPTDLNTTTASGRLNTVRFLVGDTDTVDQKVQDEEVVFSLSQTNDDVNSAASYIARTLASKYASKVTIELDGQLMAHYSDLYKNYKALADKLDYQAKKFGSQLGVLAGGISKVKVGIVREDTNRLKPAFRRDRFTNPPDSDSYS